MAVAHSAASESHTGTAGSISQASFNWTHTQTGTPQGVLVFVHVVNSSANPVSSVTYGSVTLTRVTGGAAIDAAGEPGRTDLFFAGSGLASGNQTITVNRSNTVDEMYASAATVTAATGTILNGIVLLEGDGTMDEQSVDDGTSGTNSVRYAAAYSGLNAPPTAGANSTLLTSIDFGNYTAAMVRETTAGQGARLVGFSTASDDRAAVHVAVRERVYRITGERGSFTLTGNAANTRHNVRTTGDTGKFFLPERNLVRYSEQFENVYWNKNAIGAALAPVVTANDAVAPDGTLTADRIVFDTNGSTTANDRSDFEAGVATPSVIGKTYIFSVWLKTTDGSSITIQLTHAGLNASYPTVTGSWQRFTSLSTTAVDTGRRPRLSLRVGTPTSAYASLHVWGFQWEEGTSITDYDPTGPAGATDAALRQAYRLDGGTGAFTFIGNNASTLHNVRTTGDLGKFFLPERNLVKFSEEFDNSAWIKVRSSITPNATISPDGLLRGDKVVEDTSNNTHILQLQNSIPAHTAGVTYTYSWHLKAGERTQLYVSFGADLGTFNEQAFTIILSTGEIANVSPSGFVSTPTATSVGNGWYRVSATVIANSSTLPVVRGRPVVGGTTSYLGDGVSGYFIWGAQVEQGSTTTDYDPTGPAGATDAALRQAYRLDGGRGAFTLIGNAADTLYNVRTTGDTGKFFLPERNLVRWSEQFDQAVWGKAASTVSANVIGAPTGDATADKVIESASNAEHIIYQSRTGSNETATFSVYAKAAERSRIRLAFSNFVTESRGAIYDLSSGTVVSVGASGTDYTNPVTGIVDTGNGWYRCSLTLTKGGVNTTNNPTVGPVSGAAVTYLGDGTSGFYIWGAQVEQGSTATDYDPTGPAGATDAALRQAYRLDGGTGTFTLTGQPAGTRHNSLIDGGRGVFSLSGNDATLTKAGTAKVITADVGAFTLAGNNATLLQAYALAGDRGAFTLTGNDATLADTDRIQAEAGSFTLVGNPATLTKTAAVQLTPIVGAFTLTGNPATLRRGYAFAVDAGTFAVTGELVTLRHNVRIEADTGSFALTGGTPALLHGRYLSGGAGEFIETGQPATFRRTWAIGANTGTFTLTGNPASLTEINAYEINPTLGTFDLAGQPTQLARSRNFPVDRGPFAFTGQPATLLHNLAIAADTGTFAFVGQPATFKANRAIVATSGTFVFTGNPASLFDNDKIFANTGTFTLTGAAATLQKVRRRNVLIF